MFEMSFGDMLEKAIYKIEDEDGFHNQLVIFMAVIVEGGHISVIFINT